MGQDLRHRLRAMKRAVHDLEVMGSNPSCVKIGCVVHLSKLYLNQNSLCMNVAPLVL